MAKVGGMTKAEISLACGCDAEKRRDRGRVGTRRGGGGIIGIQRSEEWKAELKDESEKVCGGEGERFTVQPIPSRTQFRSLKQPPGLHSWAFTKFRNTKYFRFFPEF